MTKRVLQQANILTKIVRIRPTHSVGIPLVNSNCLLSKPREYEGYAYTMRKVRLTFFKPRVTYREPDKKVNDCDIGHYS